MLKSKNIMLYEALSILLVFTIVYFIAANKISYAFPENSSDTLYSNKIDFIAKSAAIYGQNNLSLFEDEDTIYLTVGQLIEKGAILPDDSSNIIKDPNSDVNNLNDLKVRISLKNGKVTSKVLT